ncbi:MAG: hypothetical protein HY822_22135 [Acidobacteria bacterium]|nr:hypothetical protein [Acidobacteriota bacterium]
MTPKYAALLLLALSMTAAERPGAWTVIGPGGGGAQFLPAISPHDSNTALVACDMTGTYITRDGGASWRMFNLRGRSSLLVFDPADPDVIYARSIGLWRSTDRGDTWDLVLPDPATVTGIDMPDDHASERLVTSGPAPGSAVALAVDPADSKTLYAVLSSAGRNTLQVSTDWGSTWTAVRDVPAGTSRIYVDPRADRTLYVIAGNSVLVREEGVWRSGAPAPASFTDVSAGFPEEGGSLVVYGIAASGLWVSADGGASWNQAGPAASFTAVATSLQHPGVAYLSYKGLREGGQTFFGVARTSDTGRTWETVWKESAVKSPSVDDGWVSERFGPGWGENPLSLGVSPTHPDLCYGTDYGRTLRTTDGGKTWTAAYTRKLADGSYQSTGLDVTTNYGVHFDPFDLKRRFISYTDIGLFRGESGSQGWVSSTTAGVPRPWVNTTYWVEFDPQAQGRMWAVMSGTHDLPRPKMWRTTSPSTYQGGTARSDDGGKTWKPLTNGMPPTAATHILLDPRSPADARVLYVAGYGRGVFKSIDGGDTWALKNNGLPEKEPFAWRLAQDREGVLYLVVARRSEDTSIGTPNDGALFRSTDGAESWQRVALPAGVNGPNGLAIDPGDSRRLYLASWARRTAAGAAGGGIFLSEDGGATWRHVHSADQHVYDVTIDPRDPETLFACGFESSAWRSADRGETWQRIRGYNFKWGHRVVPDPLDAEMIYVTTFGGSVWHGPAAGDPNAVEDIVTPQVAYSQ